MSAPEVTASQFIRGLCERFGLPLDASLADIRVAIMDAWQESLREITEDQPPEERTRSIDRVCEFSSLNQQLICAIRTLSPALTPS